MLTFVTIYWLLGLVFGGAFVIRGYAVIDPGARGASPGFRLLLLPANLLLWPYLLFRWLSCYRRMRTEQ